MHVTSIGFSKNLVEEVEKICFDTSKRDPTFLYRIVYPIKGKYDAILQIESKDKDTAHKRGLLLVKKYLNGYNLLYWVSEFKEK
jgi:hypothetical protein